MSVNKKIKKPINIVIFTEDAKDTRQFLDIQKQKVKDAFHKFQCKYLSNDTKLNITNLHYRQDLIPTLNYVISNTQYNQIYTHVFLVFDKDTADTLNSGYDSRTTKNNWKQAEQIVNNWNDKRNKEDDARIEIIGMNPCFEWGLAQLFAKNINQSPKQCKNKLESIEELNRILEQYSKSQKDKQILTYSNKEKIWTLVDLCSYSWDNIKKSNKQAKGDISDSANNELNYSELYKLFEMNGYESK